MILYDDKKKKKKGNPQTSPGEARYDPTQVVHNDYYDNMSEIDPYIINQQNKQDSAFFYPLHNRLNEWMETKGDTARTPLEEKHLQDIMLVTQRSGPVGTRWGNEKYPQLQRELQMYKHTDQPEVVDDLGRDIAEMSHGDLNKIMQEDYSSLKGMSLVSKLGKLVDLKPKNMRYWDLFRYGRYFNSSEGAARYNDNIRWSRALKKHDPEYFDPEDEVREAREWEEYKKKYEGANYEPPE